MKKNISFMNLDPSLAKWIYEKIQCSDFNSASKSEFAENMMELINGTTDALFIELKNDRKITPIQPEIHYGTLSIDPRLRKVIQNGTELSLTPKEFDILYFLARNKGEVFTKEQIYKAVWEDDYMLDDSNIMAFIRKLRKKIEPNPDAPEYIITIWGIGYKFNDTLK